MMYGIDVFLCEAALTNMASKQVLTIPYASSFALGTAALVVANYYVLSPPTRFCPSCKHKI